MSCRVFSRRIENCVFDFLRSIAKNNHLNKISFDFVLTKKNIYLQNFLKEIGFNANKNGKYLMNLNEIKNSKKHFIKNIKL